MKILPGLTTTPKSDWRKKMKEINKFKIKEIALFLTGLNPAERKELYFLLKKGPTIKIPHVHLRTDCTLQEVKFLEETFGVEVFNIHSKEQIHSFENFKECCPDYNSKTYLENTEYVPDEEELFEFAGLCIDFSHWEDGLLLDWDSYKNSAMQNQIRNFPVGCSHISAIGHEVHKTSDLTKKDLIYVVHSKHLFDDLKEFDYLKKFVDYFPRLISLELENSFEEQLLVKEYIKKIINSSHQIL